MITIEVDYYSRCDEGVRYHVRTVRLEVPEGYDDVRLPFYLTAKVGEHHGILRVKRVV